MRFLRGRQSPEERDQKLQEGLERSRRGFFGQMAAVFEREEITDETWEDLEELLIASDIGVETTFALVEELRDRAERERFRRPSQLREALMEGMLEILSSVPPKPQPDAADGMLVTLVVGVNGVGKTTS